MVRRVVLSWSSGKDSAWTLQALNNDPAVEVIGLLTTYNEFPIWQTPTDRLARTLIDTGLEAVVTCIDAQKLPRAFAGRRFDHAFLDELPSGVDPCGENGEFHTCVLAGPVFEWPVEATVGEISEKNGFVFADLTLN